MKTITITWKAFSHGAPTSATFETSLQGHDFAICEALFVDTNHYRGILWDALEAHLPEERTHTALSVGDEVTIDGQTYVCADIGWKALSNQ